VAGPCVFRLFLSQRKFPQVHTKITVRKMAELNTADIKLGTCVEGVMPILIRPSNECIVCRTDAEATPTTLRTFSDRFGLNRGVAGRFLAKGSYYFQLEWNGRPLFGLYALRYMRHVECDPIIQLELAVAAMDQRPTFGLAHSPLHACGNICTLYSSAPLPSLTLVVITVSHTHALSSQASLRAPTRLAPQPSLQYSHCWSNLSSPLTR